jgi:hypothetical protein
MKNTLFSARNRAFFGLFLCLFLIAQFSFAQVAVTPAPFVKSQYFNGTVPCNACLLYTYAAGTTTPLVSYTDSTGVTPNADPVVLDSSGYGSIWLGPSAYKLTLKTSAGATIWTVDGVNGGYANFLSLNGGNALSAIADPAASLGKFWLSSTLVGRIKWSDASAIHTVVGVDTTDTLTNKTLTSPVVTNPSTTGTDSGAETLTNKTLTSPTLSTGVAADGSGFKHKRVASCATGAGANAVCTTVVTWGTAFADGNYTAVCTLVNGAVAGGSVTRVVGVALAASVTVEITNGPAGGANSGAVECIAVHD